MSLKVNSKKIFNHVLDLYSTFTSTNTYDYLNLEEDKDAILKLASEIDSSTFKIAVIGEFSTGKSTLINSFLQQDLLPAKYRPTTNQVTLIKNSETAYVQVENEISSRLSLSKENVSKINESSNKNIEIGLKLPNLSDYEIYDTPGVNDPSMFSDEIVFDLIGNVDIVIFVLHATQVLKQSEIIFLTELIRKKDVSKFFFIINQSDLIEQEQHEVRNDFLDRISHLLETDRVNIANKTFLYSAKDSLKFTQEHNVELLRESNYPIIIEAIDHFIKDNKSELFNAIAKRNLSHVIKNSLVKIDTALDKIDGKDKAYQHNLKIMKKEIDGFQIDIEDAIYDFRKKFDKQKDIFKINIQQSFDAIGQRVIEEVATMPIEQLLQGRHVEIRTKKLIEDTTDEQFQLFFKALAINFENLNSTIDPIFNQKTIVINNLINKTISSTVVNGLAMGGAVIGAVIYTPTILSVGAAGIGLSAIASTLGSFGPVGMIFGGVSGAISTAGLLAMQAGKFAFDLAKWGVKLIGDYANNVENIMKIKQYQSSVKVSIDSIRNDILYNIDQEINSSTYIEAFIDEKFPQKEELKRKIEASKKDFEVGFDKNTIGKNELENMKLQLEESIK